MSTGRSIVRMATLTVLVAAISATGKADSPATDHPPASRRPIPDAVDRATAVGSVKSLFSKEIAAAKLPHQKVAVTRSLLEMARKTKDDPASQYELIQQAIGLATEAGNVTLGYQAIDMLDSEFQETHPYRLKAALCESVSSTAFPLTTAKEISDRVLADIESSIEADSLEEAGRFVEAGIQVAKRLNAKAQLAVLEVVQEEVQGLRRQCDQYQTAVTHLRKDPAVKEHNKIVGAFLALRKHEWIRAEQHLSIADEQDLRKLVLLECMPPQDIAGQVQLADAWWQTSTTLADLPRLQAQSCAAFWYQGVVGSVEGLTKRRIEDRLVAMDARWRMKRRQAPRSLPPAMPPTPDRTKEPPPRTELDVLTLMGEVTRYAKKGKWQLQDGELIPLSSRGIMGLPVHPDGSYTFRFDLFRGQGHETILITLPVARRQVYVELSRQPGRRNAMSFIKGRHSDSNGTVSDASMIKNGEWNQVQFSVDVKGEDCTIVCEVNERRAVSWSGEWRDVGIDGNWGPQDDDQLGLASVEPGIRFKNVKFAGVLKAAQPAGK